ncbi:MULTISPECIES: hypothetical protein [Bradyrhizobium]|nr:MULTISPECIES: hypothetical protein [Bradyrhizobium]
MARCTALLVLGDVLFGNALLVDVLLGNVFFGDLLATRAFLVSLT